MDLEAILIFLEVNLQEKKHKTYLHMFLISAILVNINFGVFLSMLWQALKSNFPEILLKAAFITVFKS